ncbi:hypothetical protein [Aquimarina muelleri]|uniref:Uncharacterized protein n=1 Tax=Aquimarina muelleri TaxID=279356 RepID=A0A918N3D1_9FLAO|nr:hypothetical protein [Aquimarina muelleri]MCX2761301.1 hypothetical protein [Aquimarina muelleri]GGX12385.1 hypothetical protein GCM10007384_12720 [Aquimarina muelleri]
MKKIIIGTGFYLHQKIILILLFIAFLIPTIISFLSAILLILGLFIQKGSILIKWYHGLLLFSIFLFLSSIFFYKLTAKKGIYIKDHKLYQAKFIFGKLIRKKNVDLTNKTDVSKLTFKGRYKFAWVSIATPDASQTIQRFEIHIFNERHTDKFCLIETFKEDIAEKIIKLLQEELKLNYQSYNPRF